MRDQFLQSHPSLVKRLQVERQYCPSCFIQEPSTTLTPPFERLGHDRLWEAAWGRKMATALAKVHIANGLQEPKVPLGAGLTRINQQDSDRRLGEATALMDAGLTEPLSRDLLAPIMAQLAIRTYHNRMSLANEPSSVHINSLWNVEPSNSVVILHDDIHLLNPRLDNVRRSPGLDPMNNLARYVYLSRIVTRQPGIFRRDVEGPWLLQTYFDVAGFTDEARQLSISRFWRWLDLEFILYFYYFVSMARVEEYRPNISAYSIRIMRH